MKSDAAVLEGGLQSVAGADPAGAARQALHPVVWLFLLATFIPIAIPLGPVVLTALRALLIVVIPVLLAQLLSGRFGRIYLVDILFVLHVIWMGMSLFVNNPDKMVEQIGSVGAEFLGGYLVGRGYVRSPEQFAALCRALVLMVCLTAPLALYETLSGRPLILEALQSTIGLRGIQLNYQEPRMGLERVQMSFAHPIHYGLFCSVAFSLGFVGLKNSRKLSLRMITSGIVGLCGFLALSSGALLAIFLQICLISWARIFQGFRKRWWLLLGLFALAYLTIDLLSNRSPIQVFMSYATFSAHTAYWRSIIFDWGIKNVIGDASVNIKPAPWFGIGLNDWVRPYYMYSGSMDNFWLVVAVRTGIPGFLFMTVGYVVVIFRMLRLNLSDTPELSHFRLAWAFTIIGLTFTLCTVHVWGSIYSFTFFIFGSGLWLLSDAARRPVSPRVAPLPEVTPDAPDTEDGARKIRYSRFPVHEKPLRDTRR